MQTQSLQAITGKAVEVKSGLKSVSCEIFIFTCFRGDEVVQTQFLQVMFQYGRQSSSLNSP
eukprot:m.67208 g.67208  ORF g.67208 m.67208 type:complete len:61 (+) comp11572_c0_seq1:1332-1514(+)